MPYGLQSHNTRISLRYFLRASLRYPKSLVLVAIGIIGAAVLNGLTPLYFKQLFDLLTHERGAAVAHELLLIVGIIAALRLAQWIGWRVGTFSATYFESKVMTDLTNMCYEYLQRHSFGFFNDNFVGSLVKKVRWFSRAFEIVADRIFWNLLPLVVTLTIVISVLLRRNTLIGLGIVVWLIIFFIVNAIFIRFKLRYDIARSEAETKATGFIADTITNQGTIKLFDGYERETLTSRNVHELLRRLRLKTWNFNNYFEATQGLLMTILEIGVFVLAVRYWQQGRLTVGDFVLIQSYLIYVFNNIWDFGKVFRQIFESLADAEEMTVILETPHEVTDAPRAKQLLVTDGQIEFDQVDFNYHRTRPILKKFSLTIKAHERLAIVGPSGAGKTTLVKLLLRMHDVAAGHIRIDGQDIAQVTQSSQHRQIGLVPQDPILFHRSLEENIRYGRPDANHEEVIAAARMARCHDFIVALPDGYDTKVGERGVKLSSGERQRVAIARAILYNAPILILDEATSSLDSESERLIQEALHILMQGKTVIAIAHRLSTIKKMDRIIVIENGAIREDGAHETLLKQQGMYTNLWKLQAGGFI